MAEKETINGFDLFDLTLFPSQPYSVPAIALSAKLLTNVHEAHEGS